MDQLLKDYQVEMLSSIVLPPGRFFTPNYKFWSLMYGFKKRGWSFVECGAGSGALLEEADSFGLHFRGVDICKREGQSVRVEIEDARDLVWQKNVCPLICRPDHSGWITEVIRKAGAAGSASLVIGLSRNYFKDLEEFRTMKVETQVGDDGENAYLIPAPVPRRATAVKKPNWSQKAV